MICWGCGQRIHFWQRDYWVRRDETDELTWLHYRCWLTWCHAVKTFNIIHGAVYDKEILRFTR
jgi:hypothetical protein